MTRIDAATTVAADPAAREAVEAFASTAQQTRTAVLAGNASGSTAVDLRTVLTVIARVTAGQEPGPRDLAELALALRDDKVQQVMFAFTDAPYAAAVEYLWTRLVRALTGEDQTQAALRLTYSAYLRGDLDLAVAAVDVAIDNDRKHDRTDIVHGRLRAGLKKGPLKQLAVRARAISRELLGENLDDVLAALPSRHEGPPGS
ncbi:DUF4192 family protein [Nocardia sp. NPDC055321]